MQLKAHRKWLAILFVPVVFITLNVLYSFTVKWIQIIPSRSLFFQFFVLGGSCLLFKLVFNTRTSPVKVRAPKWYTTLGIFLLILIAELTIGGILEALFPGCLANSTTDEIRSMLRFESFFSAVIIGPILEEFLFRRLYQNELSKHFDYIPTIILSGLVFTALHGFGCHSIVLLAVGLIYAWAYQRYRSLKINIAIHSLSNALVWLAQT